MVAVRVDRRDVLVRLDDVGEDERLRMVANAAEQVLLLPGGEMVDAEDRDDEIPGAVGQRILHPGESHLDPHLAGPEDHVRARVEPGDLRVRVCLEQAPRRLSGADPEVEDGAGGNGTAFTAASCSRSNPGTSERIISR